MVMRYSGRKPATARATLCCEDRVRASTILDLSVPGCHLATSLPLQKGQCVRMDIYLSNQPPMRIDLGVVRWAVGGEAGIEFIRMSEEDASQLRAYAGAGKEKQWNAVITEQRPDERIAWKSTEGAKTMVW